MKESSTKYARQTWIDTYEGDVYDELLRECYEKCKVPKKRGQKRHKWRCIYCEEVFPCRPSLNYHRHKVCPAVGHRLKQYPVVGKGQRIVMKDQQAIVKGQLGKCKGGMASVEEDGMPHTITDWLEVDNLHEFLQDTQTHQPPVMTTPNICSVLLEERGVSSSGERSPVCDLGVFEGTETVDTTGLAMGSENHEHVEVEGEGEGHALKVEDEEWGWSPLFCLLRDFPKLRPPNFPPRPWKHTEEEFDVIHKFFKHRKAHRTKTVWPHIVLALKATWHFHFGKGSSMIEHYPKLVEELQRVSQDREFVHNLLRMQHLMTDKRGHLNTYGRLLFLEFSDYFPPGGKAPTLEDDVSSFKATSTSREHEEVVKRVLDSLILITCCAMEHLESDVQKNMWHLAQNYDKESAMSVWKFQCFHQERLSTGFTLEYLTDTYDEDTDMAVSAWRLMLHQIRAPEKKYLYSEDSSEDE